MSRKLGYLRAPADPRDYSAKERLRAVPVPVKASLIDHVVAVLDQGGLGSCVANGGFQAIRMGLHRQGVLNPPLGSRLFGYYVARARHHMAQEDSGTYVREFFAAISQFGFPVESAWPYDDHGDLYRKMPTPKAFRAAFDQRAPISYRRIFDVGPARVHAAKAAIAAGYPVVFGTDVSEAFASNDLGSGPIHPPLISPIAGGHCMVLVGYDGDTFDVCNSWGTGWGSHGFCRFDASYIEWSATDDLWFVEMAPPPSALVG